jgi:dienelactone hydrolase
MSPNLSKKQITITGLDFNNYLKKLYQETSRQSRFRGKTPDDFRAWETSARAKVIELLSIDHLTPKIPSMEILDESGMGDYRVQKIAYQTLPDLWVPAYLLTPTKGNPPFPTALCPPGHGGGINQVMNEDGAYHKYPHRFAEAGFVALVPENISFGERANPNSGYRGCSFEHEALNLLGGTVIGYRLWELQRALDLLETLPQVDKNRIGCAGLSLGGEMTLYLAACDLRIRVACIACFLTSFKGTFLKEPHCTCGYTPKMARYFEHADLAALIAPRPLMIQVGTRDGSFLVADAQAAYDELAPLYRMLDAEDKIALDVFEGGHDFDVEPTLAWFRRWL